jgi:hypothetical protein
MKQTQSKRGEEAESRDTILVPGLEDEASRDGNPSFWLVARRLAREFTDFRVAEETSRVLWLKTALGRLLEVILLDPLLPLLQSRGAPQDGVAEPLASHEDELAAAVFGLAASRHVKSGRVFVVRVAARGAQIGLHSVHAPPLGRRPDQLMRAFGSEDGRHLADDARGPHRQQRPVQLIVVEDGRDGAACHEVAAAEHVQRLLNCARPTFWKEKICIFKFQFLKWFSNKKSGKLFLENRKKSEKMFKIFQNHDWTFRYFLEILFEFFRFFGNFFPNYSHELIF